MTVAEAPSPPKEAPAARPKPKPPAPANPAVGRFVLPTAAILALLALQELLTRTEVLPPNYFPPATEIFAALFAEIGNPALTSALYGTLSTWLMALVISVSLGTAVGILLGLLVPLEAFLRPVIEFLRPVPSVALIPLVVLTIGTGSRSALFLAVFAAFWQVLVPAIAGVRAAHPVALETARSYNFSIWQRIRYIQIPSMMPYLATAVRLATSTSLILIVTAEIIIQMPGLGYEITMSRSAGNPARMYAYIALSGAAGILLNGLVRKLESRLFATHSMGGK